MSDNIWMVFTVDTNDGLFLIIFSFVPDFLNLPSFSMASRSTNLV